VITEFSNEPGHGQHASSIEIFHWDFSYNEIRKQDSAEKFIDCLMSIIGIIRFISGIFFETFIDG